jgi:ankyrin repeat protein
VISRPAMEFEKLITANVDINDSFVWQGHQAPLLSFAVSAGRRDNAEILLRHGAEVDRRDSWGFTPLMHAVVIRDLVMAEILLSHGADANAKDARGATVLMLAVDDYPEEYRRTAEKVMADTKAAPAQVERTFPAGTGAKELVEAGTKQVLAFIQKQWQRDPSAVMPLVRVLAERGARLRERDAQGNSGLHLAAGQEIVEVVGFFLDHGEDPNQTNAAGETALMRAAQSGRVANIRLLANHGARGDLQDQLGDTALMRAANCSPSDDAVVQAVLAVPGTSVDQRNQAGATAMDFVLLSQAQARLRPWATSREEHYDKAETGESFFDWALVRKNPALFTLYLDGNDVTSLPPGDYSFGQKHVAISVNGVAVSHFGGRATFLVWQGALVVDGRDFPAFAALRALRDRGGHFGNAGVRFWK